MCPVDCVMTEWTEAWLSLCFWCCSCASVRVLPDGSSRSTDRLQLDHFFCALSMSQPSLCLLSAAFLSSRPNGWRSSLFHPTFAVLIVFIVGTFGQRNSELVRAVVCCSRSRHLMVLASVQPSQRTAQGHKIPVHADLTSSLNP